MGEWWYRRDGNRSIEDWVLIEGEDDCMRPCLLGVLAQGLVCCGRGGEREMGREIARLRRARRVRLGEVSGDGDADAVAWYLVYDTEMVLRFRWFCV